MIDRTRLGTRPSWRVVVMLFFLGWTLIYANRNVLSAVLAQIAAEWNLTRTELGLLNSAFFLAYTAGQIPTGFLADRFSKRSLLLPGYLLQSVACVLGGLVGAPGAFFYSRVIGGLGQSTYYASQYALASQYLPRERRAFGVAAINSGMAGGVIVGLFLSTYLVYSAGLHWRVPFLVVGALGVVLAAVILVVVKEDRGAGERIDRAAGKAEQVAAVSFSDRDFWLLCVAALGAQYGFYVILTWLPYYLQEVRGFSGSIAGFTSTLMPLLAAPSAIAAGWLSDKTGRRRELALCLLPVSALALALIGLTRSLAGLYTGLALYGLTGKMTLDPILVAMIADRVAERRRATALGVFNFASAVSMVMAPALTGYLADASRSFGTSFWVAVGFSLIAAAAIGATKKDLRGHAGPEPGMSA